MARGLPEGCNQNVGWGCSHLQGTLGRTHIQFHSCGLSGLTTHSHGPLHRAALQPGSWLSQNKQPKRQGEETPHREATLLHNLISEMAAHHFCHILFITRKSITPAHTQGQGITQGHEYQEVRLHSHLGDCLPQTS